MDFFRHYVKHYDDKEQENFILQLEKQKKLDQDGIKKEMVKIEKSVDMKCASARFHKYYEIFESMNEKFRKEYIQKIEDMEVKLEQREDADITKAVFSSLNPKSEFDFY